jgi:hypothetical protein
MIEISESVIALIRRRAQSGVTEGRIANTSEKLYVRRCSHFHWRTGTIIMFTRDRGHHTGGWFKNPDYEACRHLSVSFREPYPERDPDALGDLHAIGALMRTMNNWRGLVPFDADLAHAWVKAIHGDDCRYLWEEGPFTAQGKELGVRHYRVFHDLNGEAIKPRGEVYSRELTARGWRSWSDQGVERPSHVDAD